MSKPDPFLRFQGTDDYIASAALVDAVNAAVALERPLLIKGEPGTGKTLLAEHVARGLELPLAKYQVLIKFYWLREQSQLRKKPSTSELIDWISVLLRSGMSADDIEQHIPFLGALVGARVHH